VARLALRLLVASLLVLSAPLLSLAGTRDLAFMMVYNPGGANSFNYLVREVLSDGSEAHTSQGSVIPGLGHEDQAGGAAVADLDGNGVPDLIFMALDNPPQANNAWYQVLYNVDDLGIPAGRSIMHSVGGFGYESQGGGCAVTDLNRNGLPDLILMAVDNPPHANSFFYRVAFDLGSSGAYSSLSPTYGVEGVGDEASGGGLAVADLDQNGIPDLLFMAIDNPPGPNQFRYRIAYNVGRDGDYSSLSGLLAPAGSIGNDCQGGGAAFTDIDGDAHPDLVLLAVDNPPGENRFWYQVLYDLDSEGRPRSQTNVHGCGSPGTEGQGAGVCALSLADQWDSTDGSSQEATELQMPASPYSRNHHGPHSLGGHDRYDWYRVYLRNGLRYVFEGIGGSSDTYAELFASTSASSPLATDDNSGSGNMFRLTYTPKGSRYYWLRVSARTPGDQARYTLEYWWRS